VYSLSRICVRTDFDAAPLHLLGDHTPTFAAAIAFCCIPKCGREGAAGGHTDLLLVLMKVCMKIAIGLCCCKIRSLLTLAYLSYLA
jgi:hypothetical protein